MPHLTEEIKMVDEALLISKETQFVVDQSLEFQCICLACEDVCSTVGVHWIPPFMVEVLLAQYLDMFFVSKCVPSDVNADCFVRLGADKEVLLSQSTKYNIS